MICKAKGEKTMVGSLTDFVLFLVTFKLYDKDCNKLLDSSVSYSESLTSCTNCSVFMMRV